MIENNLCDCYTIHDVAFFWGDSRVWGIETRYWLYDATGSDQLGSCLRCELDRLTSVEVMEGATMGL
jgi:hypothetical protein